MKKLKRYIKNLDLKSQLLYLIAFSLIVSFISLVVILPNLLTPFYEKNIYEVLNQSLSFIEGNTNITSSNVAYIIKNDTNIYISKNFTDYFKKEDANLILKNAKNSKGKFILNNQTYYYKTANRNLEVVITLTDDSYITSQRRTFSLIGFPVISITIFTIALVLVAWGNILVSKISKIKEKVANLDNSSYDHSHKFWINDELNSLINSAEYMRKEINLKEEYRNNTFQNISHELKTPISVISGYVEAAHDGVITYESAIDTIGDEIKNLSKDVNMILELNKINYLKETNEHKDETVDITNLLTELIEKYKLQRRDVKWELDIGKKNVVRGTLEIWKTIIDNMFGNFVVYADSLIKVTIKNNKIMFYNDGEKIDDELINDIFTQYKKGIKGKFGLGLSIVKQSLNLYNYNIKAINKEKGVLFEIK